MLWYLNCISVFSLHASWKITLLLFKNIGNLSIPLTHHRKKYKVIFHKKSRQCEQKIQQNVSGDRKGSRSYS